MPKELVLQPQVRALLKKGIEHHQAGRTGSAETCYARVLEIAPRCPQALHLMGLLAQQAGQFRRSIELIRAALAGDPDDPDTLNSLAQSALGEGDTDLARDCCRRVMSLRPDSAAAHHRFGKVLEQRGDWEEAEQSYRQAISLLKDSPEFHTSLARLQNKLGAFKEAVKSCQRALALDPEKFETYVELGNALTGLGNYRMSAAAFRRALALKPGSASAVYGLGDILQKQGNLAAAADAYLCALKLAPSMTNAHLQLGVLSLQQGEWERAFGYFEQVRKFDPASAEAAAFEGIFHLLHGNFPLGWKDYENRWGTTYGLRHARRFSQPVWRGEKLKGSRILLHAEQGMGDTLQFIRYVPLVAARGGTVFLEVQPRLRRLLAETPGAEKVVARGDSLPEFDWQCPLLSLPLAFGTDLNTIPKSVPYVIPPPGQVDVWRQRLKSDGLRIGLVWGGNPKHPHDCRRSIRLEQLAPLANLSGTAFFSLQMGTPADQLKRMRPRVRIVDLQNEQRDFTDTAAIVASLDLVISIDTSVAHLAGAIGKPVWILLAKSPDWRWMLDREDSPWYPTARLFRQPSVGNWHEVVARVERELRELMARAVGNIGMKAGMSDAHESPGDAEIASVIRFRVADAFGNLCAAAVTSRPPVAGVIP